MYFWYSHECHDSCMQRVLMMRALMGWVSDLEHMTDVARRTHKWAIGIGLMPITSSSIFTVLCDIIWQYFVDVRAIAILRPSDINWTATDVESRGFLWSAQACRVDFLRFRCSSSKLSSTMLGWSPVWHCWYSIHYLLVFGWPHFSWNRQKSRLDWTSLHHFICSLRVQRLAGGEPCGSSSRFSRISLVITASTACVRHAWQLRSFRNPASDIIRSYSAICTCFVKYDTVPYLTILTYIILHRYNIHTDYISLERICMRRGFRVLTDGLVKVMKVRWHLGFDLICLSLRFHASCIHFMVVISSRLPAFPKFFRKV